MFTLVSTLPRRPARPHRPRPWLVCLDLQREHVVAGHSDHAAAGALVAAACRRILQHARSNGWRVVHSQRRRGGAGLFAAPIEDLRPRITEPVFLRRGLSALSDPDFAAELSEARGEDIYLIGFSLSDTCLATVLAAVDLGLALTLVEDAVGGASDSSAFRSLVAPFAQIVSSRDLLSSAKELTL
jgi:nicotinamidase-related amidase